MKTKAVTGIVLTVLLTGMLTLAFVFSLVKAESCYFFDGFEEGVGAWIQDSYGCVPNGPNILYANILTADRCGKVGFHCPGGPFEPASYYHSGSNSWLLDLDCQANWDVWNKINFAISSPSYLSFWSAYNTSELGTYNVYLRDQSGNLIATLLDIGPGAHSDWEKRTYDLSDYTSLYDLQIEFRLTSGNGSGGHVIFDDVYVCPTTPAVGGIWVPVDNLGLLAPYIGLASTLAVATVAAAIYAKRVKRREEKQ